MSKSKKTKVFTTEDGRRARFDFVEFKCAISKAKERPNPERPGFRTTNQDVFRRLAEALFGPCPEDVRESNAGTIKQWYSGNNGPSERDYIYKMAECLNCEKRDQFLKYENEEEKDMIINTDSQRVASPVITPTRWQLTDSYFQAMKRMKAQEEAYSLHSMFIDLIAKYNQADMDTWLWNAPLSEGWKTGAKEYPARGPAKRAVDKSSCFVGKELRHGLYAFLEDLYGTTFFEWDEISNIGEDINYAIKAEEFIDNKLKRFSSYLKEHDIDESSLDSGDKEQWMFNFLEDESIDRFCELERIFADYIVE